MMRTGSAMSAVQPAEQRPQPTHAGPPSFSFRYVALRIMRWRKRDAALLAEVLAGALAERALGEVLGQGIDDRVACVISSCGWGDGERKFRGQHPTPEAWAKFTGILEKGRKHKQETGESMWISRFDAVPIPEHLRKNLSPKAIMEIPVETAWSMYNFRADDVVGKHRSPTMLFFHTANDTITPTEQSLRMFEKGGHAGRTRADHRHLAFPPAPGTHRAQSHHQRVARQILSLAPGSLSVGEASDMVAIGSGTLQGFATALLRQAARPIRRNRPRPCWSGPICAAPTRMACCGIPATSRWSNSG